MKRTTAVALAASATLVVVSGAVAASAVLGLPFLGFGPPPGSAAAPATTPPPSVVDQTVYDDHYVTASSPSGPVRPPRVNATPAAGSSGPGVGSAASVPTNGSATGPSPTAAPPTTTPPPSTTPSPTATTRPAPPPGCREPEWDPEHRVWQCSVGN